MRSQDDKTACIMMRAEGKSYGSIANELHISKTTCTAWERELEASISELKRAHLDELAEQYGMAKEARIRRLGGTLQKIDEALAEADLSSMAPEKLLDLKLKYMDALKGEYIGAGPSLQPQHLDAKGIIAALADLLARVQAGDVTTEQAQRELAVLSQISKTYETAEVETKLEALSAVLSSRS